jgi:hypothetical protein
MVKKNTAQTSRPVATKASDLLRKESSPAKVKTVAASDLRQTKPKTPKWKQHLNKH